jgi:hypothetical protein
LHLWHRPARRARSAAAAVLCLAVAVIHVIDQGGLALRDPIYVGVGYWLLEIVAVITAILLLIRAIQLTWMLAFLVAAGPFVGYILSRSSGLPGCTDDIGNRTEPLGVVSLIVEAVLLILAVAVLNRLRRPVS